MMNNNPDKIREIVRKHYKDIAVTSSCCNSIPTRDSCCGEKDPYQYSHSLGYSDERLNELPGQANLGLGCGNPTAFSDLKFGETVLDLGSGGGMDAFIAAKLVGEEGKVIGVDMTSEMVNLAKKNAAKGGYPQVEFRQGFIEDLPVEDNSVDLVISNCVVNLSPDKARVYQEVFRVLKPGGRIAISDPIRIGEIPQEMLSSDKAFCGCISGAMSIAELETYLTSAGFTNISITPEYPPKEVIHEWLNGVDSNIFPDEFVTSMLIKATKPM